MSAPLQRIPHPPSVSPVVSGEVLPLVPQNLDAERFLLGAVVLSGAALDEAAEMVTGADFYKPLHGTLFDILVRFVAGEPFDPLSIVEAFRQSGRDVTVSWVRSMCVDVPSTRNAGYYARIVAKTSLLRRLLETTTTIANLAHDPARDCWDVLDEAGRLIYSLRFDRGNETRQRGWFAELVPTVRAALNNPAPARTMTGFPGLDRILGGFAPGDLVLLAARPAVGKSTLALQLAAHAARTQGPVLFFSLEMAPPTLIERLLAERGHVAHDRVRARSFEPDDPERLDDAAMGLAALPLWLDDQAGTINEIRARCRRQAYEAGCAPSLVVIDYLQLLQPERANASRYEQVTELSREVKRLAVDLAVPVLALCQLNRAPEQRHDHKPVLADLRDSGSLEQDADTVLLLYPAPEDDDEDVFAAEGMSTLTALTIAKNRHGPTGTVPLLFIRRWCQFRDHAPESS